MSLKNKSKAPLAWRMVGNAASILTAAFPPLTADGGSIRLHTQLGPPHLEVA